MQYREQFQLSDFPSPITLQLVEKLLVAQDAVARFDERMRRSHLREAVTHRLLYGEACASQVAEGDLVHQSDLVLLDGHCAPSKPSIALSLAYQKLHVWRHAQKGDAASLLRSKVPGEAAPTWQVAEDCPKDPLAWNASALQDWRNVLREARKLPPMVTAALIFHAWCEFAPDPTGPWRAALLSTLVLRASKLTPHSLLPIEIGRKLTPERKNKPTCPRFSSHARIEAHMMTFLSWVEAAARHGTRTLDQLATNEAIIRNKIRNKRRNSKLPMLVDLLLSRPIVSAPLAARELRVSTQAAEKMFAELGSNVHEVTGRKRYRAWAIQ